MNLEKIVELRKCRMLNSSTSRLGPWNLSSQLEVLLQLLAAVPVHFHYTKHTSRSLLRGPRLRSYGFQVPDGNPKVLNIDFDYFELCQVAKTNAKTYNYNLWMSMAFSCNITLIMWTARLAEKCCIMMHHLSCQRMPLQL